jgi:hypothetical protein
LVALLLILLAGRNPLQAFPGVTVVIMGIPAFRLVRGQKRTHLYTHVNKAKPEAARVMKRALFGDLSATASKKNASLRPN